MDDVIIQRIDAMIQEHETAVQRLRGFRDLYVNSPDVRQVVAALVSKEPPVAAPSGNGIAPPTDDGSQPTTIKPTILAIVKAEPGILPSELIDRVLERIQSNAKQPRRVIMSSYDALIAKRRLIRRGGRFYLPPGEAGTASGERVVHDNSAVAGR
jgi:hypothetical protein